MTSLLPSTPDTTQMFHLEVIGGCLGSKPCGRQFTKLWEREHYRVTLTYLLGMIAISSGFLREIFLSEKKKTFIQDEYFRL